MLSFLASYLGNPRSRGKCWTRHGT